jgi:glycosyltransferase involved in cell wall biosynthesis
MKFCSLVSILIPAYNESGSLQELYLQVNKVLAPDQPFEFIVINDGSTDDTVSVLNKMEEAYQNVIAIHHRQNTGKSNSLMQGFEIVRGDVIVLMDADLQDLPQHIPDFLEKLNEGYDLVNGWRYQRKDNSLKIGVSWIFNKIIDRILHLPIHDINCGYKAMRKEVCADMDLTGDMHRLIPALAFGLGHKITEIKIEHAPRKYGKSKYRLLRYRGLLDIISFMASTATRWRPFHVFFEIGIISLIISMLMFILSFLLVLTNNNPQFVTKIFIFFTFGTGFCLLLISSLLPIFGLTIDILIRSEQNKRLRRGFVDQSLTKIRK